MEPLTGPVPSLRNWDSSNKHIHLRNQSLYWWSQPSFQYWLQEGYTLPFLTYSPSPIPGGTAASYIISEIIWSVLCSNSFASFFLSLYLLSKNSTPAIPTPLNVLANKSVLPDVHAIPAVYLTPISSWLVNSDSSKLGPESKLVFIIFNTLSRSLGQENITFFQP